MKANGNKMRMQSAMEYLMTYGWAILIIAVVLGALFSLGVFSKASLLGTSCVAGSGFYCANPVLTSSTDTLSVTLGQATGSTWYNSSGATYITFYLVPTGTSFTGPSTANGIIKSATTLKTLNSGQQISVSFSNVLGSSSISIGTPWTGYIYANYSTTSGGTPMYSQIATVTVKST